MKKGNKGILDSDMVISAENIQKMGEIIALTCIKTVMFRSGKDLRCLYNGLLHDMNRSQDDYSPFSNAYDIVQEAILFLCQHIGEKLGDICNTKYGKKTTIRSAFKGCSSIESITIPFVGASKTANNGYNQVFGYIFGYETTTSSSSTVSGATNQYSNGGRYYWYYIPSSLKSVVIGDGTTAIPSSAFKGCTGLTSIGNSANSSLK